MLTTYESLSFKLFSLLFGSLFSLTQTARTRSTRCFRCLSSYWNGTYKLIRFNRNLDAWSTFVFLPSAQPWWYLTPGKPCCSGTKRVTKSVSDSVPHFVLHKDLFSVRGYAGCGQLLMMKNLNIPGFLFSVGLMEFSFALLWKRKGKKKSFNKSALRRCLSAYGGSINYYRNPCLVEWTSKNKNLFPNWIWE